MGLQRFLRRTNFISALFGWERGTKWDQVWAPVGSVHVGRHGLTWYAVGLVVTRREVVLVACREGCHDTSHRHNHGTCGGSIMADCNPSWQFMAILMAVLRLVAGHHDH